MFADAADAKAKQEADKSRYNPFLKPSAENLLHDLQDESASEDEYEKWIEGKRLN